MTFAIELAGKRQTEGRHAKFRQIVCQGIAKERSVTAPHKLCRQVTCPQDAEHWLSISLMSGSIVFTLDLQPSTSVVPVWPCLLAGAQACDQTDLCLLADPQCSYVCLLYLHVCSQRQMYRQAAD